MSKQRYIWADSLKGWLMLLVIMGHAIQSTFGVDCGTNHVWNLIYSFHMPAFMAVSGWLAYRNLSVSKPTNNDWGDYLNVCQRRSFQLLVPFIVWSMIRFALSGDYSIRHLLDVVIRPDAYFWFLWVLFWICVIFNLAQLVASKLRMNEMFLILGSCLLLFGVMVEMEIRVLGFQFLAYYFLFYTLGYCLHKFENSLLLNRMNNPYIMGVLAILWTFLAWGWTMHGLPLWMPSIPHLPSTLLQYAYRGFTALVAIMVLIGSAHKILNDTSTFNHAISKLGVVSLGLYVVHLSIMGYVVTAVQLVVPSIGNWMCVSVSFIVALAISYFVVWLLSRNKHTARIFLGKL